MSRPTARPVVAHYASLSACSPLGTCQPAQPYAFYPLSVLFVLRLSFTLFLLPLWITISRPYPCSFGQRTLTSDPPSLLYPPTSSLVCFWFSLHSLPVMFPCFAHAMRPKLLPPCKYHVSPSLPFLTNGVVYVGLVQRRGAETAPCLPRNYRRLLLSSCCVLRANAVLARVARHVPGRIRVLVHLLPQ
jgi:hypothetical protein